MIWERAGVLGRWGAGVPPSVLQLEHPPIAFSTRILAVANRRAVTHPCLLTALSRHVLDDSHSLPPRFISDRICFSPLHLGLVLVSAHPMPATIDKTRHCDQ